VQIPWSLSLLRSTQLLPQNQKSPLGIFPPVDPLFNFVGILPLFPTRGRVRVDLTRPLHMTLCCRASYRRYNFFFPPRYGEGGDPLRYCSSPAAVLFFDPLPYFREFSCRDRPTMAPYFLQLRPSLPPPPLCQRLLFKPLPPSFLKQPVCCHQPRDVFFPFSPYLASVLFYHESRRSPHIFSCHLDP